MLLFEGRDIVLVHKFNRFENSEAFRTLIGWYFYFRNVKSVIRNALETKLSVISIFPYQNIWDWTLKTYQKYNLIRYVVFGKKKKTKKCYTFCWLQTVEIWILRLWWIILFSFIAVKNRKLINKNNILKLMILNVFKRFVLNYIGFPQQRIERRRMFDMFKK